MAARYRRFSDGKTLTEDEMEKLFLRRLGELTPEDIAAYTEYSGVGIEEMSLGEWVLESDEFERIDDEAE